jgi:hypothetical protein
MVQIFKFKNFNFFILKIHQKHNKNLNKTCFKTQKKPKIS